MCFNSLTYSGALLTYRAKFTGTLVPMLQVRFVEKGPPGAKEPAKIEQVDKVNMPGFVHPEDTNDEGYFTQKAKNQLEELKKKMDKPKVENTEKKD